MPDKVYKSNQVRDEQTKMVVNRLGPEEKFAGKVLLSLKDQISEARNEIQELEKEIEEKTEDATRLSEEIIEKARSQAEEVEQQARQEAENIIGAREEEVADARQEGYDDGYSEGWEKSRNETAELIAHGEKILDEARRERQAYLAENEQQLIELARQLAIKIVREKVDMDDEVIVRTVQAALDQVSDVKEISLIISPDDYEAIEKVIESQKDNHPTVQEISVVQEPHMEKGGCRIRTDYGDIDATLSGQLEHLTEKLLSTP